MKDFCSFSVILLLFFLENGTLDNKDIAFVERMRIQVMKNLVLTIRNFHMSYEMKSPTKLGHPFSFGITLHYLEVTVGIFFNSRISEERTFRQQPISNKLRELKETHS